MLAVVSISIFGCVQSHSGYIPIFSVPGVVHSVLLTSVLGHVQSHSRGGHVVCSSASVGTVSLCCVGHISSGRLSVDKTGHVRSEVYCDNLQHTIPASSPHLLGLLFVCVQSISVDSVPVQPKPLIPKLEELLP